VLGCAVIAQSNLVPPTITSQTACASMKLVDVPETPKPVQSTPAVPHNAPVCRYINYITT
jgi:hypothetical protein